MNTQVNLLILASTFHFRECFSSYVEEYDNKVRTTYMCYSLAFPHLTNFKMYGHQYPELLSLHAG